MLLLVVAYPKPMRSNPVGLPGAKVGVLEKVARLFGERAGAEKRSVEKADKGDRASCGERHEGCTLCCRELPGAAHEAVCNV